MKLILPTLLAGAAFAIATPASAQSYGTSQADYRAYCRDDEYHERYRTYCSRYDRDDDNAYDDNGDGYAAGNDDDDEAYDDQSGVQNSNYNHNRTYLPGYRSGDDDSADSNYGDSNDDYDDNDADDDAQGAVPGRTQGNTGGYGEGNDSNSYTGQRSTTH